MIYNEKERDVILGILDQRKIRYSLTKRNQTGAPNDSPLPFVYDVNIMSGRIDEAINDMHLRDIHVEYSAGTGWNWTFNAED